MADSVIHLSDGRIAEVRRIEHKKAARDIHW
jgi:hypothetical protein